MSTQIIGTKFLYEIDKKDFPDGFIASGTESFVFKGKKISLDEYGKSDLSFSCVLKFKPKSAERLERFKNQELKIFEELQECRSVARIYDVIEDIGDNFELEIPHEGVFIRNSNSNGSSNILPCFCVVEEYIDGWSLEQYCRRQFWGLEKYKNNQWINFHEFSQLEKEEVLKKYKDEKIFFRYQDKMLRFMQSLCGILMFISTTSKRKVLHLDIKPENIMVTRQSEELVLIDFGRSVFIPDGERFIYHDLPNVNYNEPDDVVIALYSHGTIGYAAPECFALPNNSKFPFTQSGYQISRMSIESDIFSFGATFWECMNIVELVANSKEFADSPHDFYQKYILNDEAYFNRDLSLECTGPLGGRYHLSLQRIINKCTKQRNNNYLDISNNEFYHFYEDLKNDIEEARESIPTVKKGENKQIKNASIAFGACVGCVLSLFVTLIIYRAVGFKIATNNWNKLKDDILAHSSNSSTYLTTQFDKISEISIERMGLADSSQKKDVCNDCYEFLSEDNDITALETSLVISLVKSIESDEEKMSFVDKIMEKANPVELSSIASSINSLGFSEGSQAYNLAVAIYSSENTSNYNYYDAYLLLKDMENNTIYKNAVKHLAVSLNNKGDRVINEIASQSNEKRSEVSDFLTKLEKQ